MDQSQMADCIRQNQVNSIEDSILKAFDSLCNSKEQSYDDFLNSFMFLTKDDLNKQGATTTSPQETVANKIGMPAKHDTLVEQESIDEQELEHGTTMPDFLNRSCTSNIQLDNYVDDESSPLSSEEESEEFSPRYVASILSKKDDKEEPKRDSTGELLPDVQSKHGKKSSAKQTLPVGDLVYPGEVEELPTTPREGDIRRSTQLDFTTVNSGDVNIGDAGNNSTVITLPPQEESDDSVKPFQLDEGFDYDNVILTPKYSGEDLNLMGPDLRKRFETS